jgi:general secretion pathway protein N
MELVARQACCIFGATRVQIKPGLGRLTVTIPPAPNGIGQWPAAWLSGLGTPFNTLQLGGTMRLATPGARIEYVQGRWRLDGQATLDLAGVSSRISTLDELGSYRIVLSGNAASGDTASMQVSTTSGALQLSGSGQWAGPTLRFRGEAVAAEGSESALNNLLNIIGRRQGARSVISIG